MRTTIVFSPHYDDAVLSCGQFLAGRADVQVVTVFAGMPHATQVLTSYDRLCGFPNAEIAVKSRRAENEEAMAFLGCKAVNLSHVDSQYGEKANKDKIVKTMRGLIEHHDPEFVVGPLGLVHPDHELVRECFLEATTDAAVPVWLYADIPSRVDHPETIRATKDAVRSHGLTFDRGFIGDGPLAGKMAALWCYRSQIGLFPNFHELLVSERFWKLSKAEEAA
jgi:LmbE family N-acetylglucosaminyl deacetylase